MDFLQLAGKRILVCGLANRKSVACHVTRLLLEAGAEVFLSVRDEAAAAQAEKLFPGCARCTCDVEREEEVRALGRWAGERCGTLHGFVHSIAFADYAGGPRPFHEVEKAEFLRAMDVSMFSLVSLANALRPVLDPDASVVTISISTTRMAAENYGYMAPVKAALDSAVCFLAKSFSAFSRVRFNSVNPGLLKTSASAGIPGYLESYLYAEQVIPRRRGLRTEEVAAAVAFLLSPRASGINGQGIVIDAGMSFNYFDREIVRKVTRVDGT